MTAANLLHQRYVKYIMAMIQLQATFGFVGIRKAPQHLEIYLFVSDFFETLLLLDSSLFLGIMPKKWGTNLSCFSKTCFGGERYCARKVERGNALLLFPFLMFSNPTHMSGAAFVVSASDW
jgi:hypothetical protein